MAVKLATALLVLGALSAAAQAGRVFVLADDQGRCHLYAAYRESPWPEADAEAGEFAQIARALKNDRSLGVMMIAPDRDALQRAERALATQLRQKARRLAIRQQVGPLAPAVLYGRREAE